MSLDYLSPELGAKIRETIASWEQASGVSLEKGTRVPLNEFANFCRLRELVKSDNTGGFAMACCLRELADEMRAGTVTLDELIDGPRPSTKQKLDIISRASALSNDPAIVAFRGVIMRMSVSGMDALEVTEQTRTSTLEIIASPEIGGILQKAGEWLTVAKTHQLCRGAGRGDAFRLNTWLYRFTSIDLAAQAVLNQPVDGLTLCLITDDPVEYSYFAIGIKVGGNVYFLHEDNGLGHRDQRHRRRNPGRDLERRLQNNHFPYDSAFKFDLTRTASGSGEQYRIKLKGPADGRIVLHDDKAHQLIRICDLQPVEILWLLLLTYRIRDQYWTNEKQLDQLSYSGGMVSLSLPNGTASTALALVGNPGLNIAVPSLAAVTNISPEDYKRVGWEYKPRGHNQPLVDAYLSDFDQELLWSKNARLLAGRSGDDAFKRAHRSGRHTDELPSSSTDRFGDIRAFEEQLADGHLLASKEQIEGLQIHEARKRLAKALQTALNREFTEKFNEVAKWLQAKFNSAEVISRLLAIAATGSFEDFSLTKETFGSSENRAERTNVVAFKKVADENFGLFTFGSKDAIGLLHPDFERKDGPRRCCVQFGKSGSRKANLNFIAVRPTTADGLAALLGIAREELPRGLQHWGRAEPYIGNTILDHLDPLDLVKNPWRDLQIMIGFYASNRALELWRKTLAAGKPLSGSWLKAWNTSLPFEDRPVNSPLSEEIANPKA